MSKRFTEEAGYVADYVICLSDGRALCGFEEVTGAPLWGMPIEAQRYGLPLAEFLINTRGLAPDEMPQIVEWDEFHRRAGS